MLRPSRRRPQRACHTAGNRRGSGAASSAGSGATRPAPTSRSGSCARAGWRRATEPSMSARTSATHEALLRPDRRARPGHRVRARAGDVRNARDQRRAVRVRERHAAQLGRLRRDRVGLHRDTQVVRPRPDPDALPERPALARPSVPRADLEHLFARRRVGCLPRDGVGDPGRTLGDPGRRAAGGRALRAAGVHGCDRVSGYDVVRLPGACHVLRGAGTQRALPDSAVVPGPAATES